MRCRAGIPFEHDTIRHTAETIAGVLQADRLAAILVEIAIAGGETRSVVGTARILEKLLELHLRPQSPVVVAVDPAEAHPESGVHDRVDDAILGRVTRIDVLRFARWIVARDLDAGRCGDIDECASCEVCIFEQIGRDSLAIERKVEFLFTLMSEREAGSPRFQIGGAPNLVGSGGDVIRRCR